MRDKPHAIDPRRRSFVRSAGLLALGAAASRRSFASTAAGERALSFYNTHTSETLTTVYWAQGSYFPEALNEINRILRDHRSGEVKAISPALLDLAQRLRAMLDTQAPIHIISGYRSPATNARLARASGGVAKHSMHLEGAALDLRLPGCDLKDVHRAALALQRGGVGYYARSDFVHIDVGRVRRW